MSLQYNITTYNNQTMSLVVEWQTYSGASSGSAVPVNLTGYTSILQVRQYAGSPTALFSVGSFPASGITLNSPSTGSISINVSPNNYASAGTGTFYYDLLCIDPLGNQYVILYGEYILNPGVSQTASFVSIPSSSIPISVQNLEVTSSLTSTGLTTLTNVVASSGSINNTTIGLSGAAAADFTSLAATTLNVSSSGTLTNFTLVTPTLQAATTATPPASSNNLTVTNTAWVQSLLVLSSANIGASGSNQATAQVLSNRYTVIINTASGNGVVLPSSASSTWPYTVLNRSGATILLYPSTGLQIESQGTNNPIDIVNGGSAVLFFSGGSQWYVV